MGNSTIGFIDSSGNNWTTGYSYNNISNNQVVKGTAQINKYATSITVYYEFQVFKYIFIDTKSAPAGVNLYVGSNTVDLFRLKDISFGGCTFAGAAPDSSGQRSYTLTDAEVQSAVSAGAISLTMWSCPQELGTSDYVCTAYTVQDIPQASQYVDVNITVNNPIAKPIDNVPVILESSSGSQYSQDTDSSGVAGFRSIPLGTYQIKITYNPFSDVDQGLTVDGTTDYRIQMQCPSGGQYQLGVCVAGGIPGQIVTALEVAGLVGGGLLVTYGVVKAIPRKEEYIRESLGKAKRYAGSYASRGAAAIKRIPSYIREKF